MMHLFFYSLSQAVYHSLFLLFYFVFEKNKRKSIQVNLKQFIIICNTRIYVLTVSFYNNDFAGFQKDKYKIQKYRQPMKRINQLKNREIIK